MSKLILIYFTLIFGVLFTMLPETEPVGYFPFSDMKLSYATHVYFICERIGLILLASIIANEAVEYKFALWTFYSLTVCDLLDYLLTYNEVWFTFEGIPISMNIMKAIIFGLVILRELILFVLEWSR